MIPARYASTRLPGKPLREIGGKAMIEHVYRRALDSGAAEVIVATDDARIAEVCTRFGADVVMTAASHPSGTDRLAEVAEVRNFAATDVVVNVQGDEPTLPSENIAQVARLLQDAPHAAIATLATPIDSLEDYLDPNVVKVVTTSRGEALYFSRASVPWHRDAALHQLTDARRYSGAWRHVGLYAYRCQALCALAASPPSRLEMAESLEQLRALELGLTIVVAAAVKPPGPGVDTEADLQKVELALRGDR